MAKERNKLISQRPVQEPLALVHPIDANEFTESMAHVSLKEKEISQLVQEKKQLEKLNKEKQDKINKLKDSSWAKRC